jgi:hypothetical protein
LTGIINLSGNPFTPGNLSLRLCLSYLQFQTASAGESLNVTSVLLVAAKAALGVVVELEVPPDLIRGNGIGIVKAY